MLLQKTSKILFFSIIFTLLLSSCGSIEMYDSKPLQAMCYDKNGNLLFDGPRFSWDKCHVDFSGRQLK